MITEIALCDRCGKDAKLTWFQQSIIKRTNQLYLFSNNHKQDLVFCTKCMDEFLKWKKQIKKVNKQ